MQKELKIIPQKSKKAISYIAQISFDDGVIFAHSSITTEQIKKDADYTGIRIKMDASLGQAKKRIQLDIGFGDVIIPGPLNIEFPTLLDNSNPKIAVYSMESVIAEKFEAMVKLAMINSRMKDFYDIYSLSFSQIFKSNSLKKAIKSTFLRRKTIFPDNAIIFRSEFHHDKEKQIQWNAFIRKTRLIEVDKNFNQVMDRITIFLKPIVNSIKGKTNDDKIWDINNGIWKKYHLRNPRHYNSLIFLSLNAKY
ncbi:MAG: nucleotidyl transferase AbiEii/AbiGii toxin family protein [bacterium]